MFSNLKKENTVKPMRKSDYKFQSIIIQTVCKLLLKYSLRLCLNCYFSGQ